MLQAGPVAGESRVLLHRFRLDRLLGRGGAGEVYDAFDLLHERQVALKLLRADAADPDLDESLRGEFRVLRGLAHPGIVQVYDFGRDSAGTPFYTMELLDGHDLAAAREIDPHALLEQVGRALDYLHANGLVHSDLKPSNVFRVGDRYKLTDFGLVQRARGARRDGQYGTLAYMPPERLRTHEGPPDRRQDLYALGAILFEVLCGRPPYASDTAEKTLSRILDGDLDTELEDAPEAWARLLRRMLARDPAARFASAWDLLQTWSRQFDRPTPPAPNTPPPFVGRRRELAAIRDALADVPRGRGTLIYVAGGPGVGKSALLEAAAAQAAACGLLCWRFERPTAARSRALVEELASLYRHWRTGLPAGLRDAADELSAWPQALRRAANEDEVANVHAHALEALQRIAAAVPHVLLLDDAHRLDHGSRALLRSLAVRIRELGLVVLAGGRSAVEGSSGQTTNGALAKDLALAAREGAAVQVFTLRELGAEDVTTLVRRRFDASDELDPLAQRVFELTLGHPFFVAETLQHLVSTGQLRRQSGGWTLLSQAEGRLVPRVANTILAEHLAAARDTDREVYEVLALFAGGADAEVLGTILGRPADEVRAALERGVSIGLLAPARHGFRFGHDLIREACATRCSEETAKRHHRRIANALVGSPAEAHHRLQAGERTAESRECFLREARNYESRRAIPEALKLYAAALEIAEGEGAEAEAEPDSGAGFAGAGPGPGELAMRVADLRIQSGQAEEAAALLTQRLASVGEPLHRARLLHRLGSAHGSRGRNEEALSHMQAAAPLFRAHADLAEQSTFIADLVLLLLTKGDTTSAIGECARMLAALPAGEAPAQRANLQLLQGQAERQNGDYAAAEATCRAALETLKPLGRTRDLAQAYTQIGTNYVYRRDFEQAERFYRAALKVLQELGDLQKMKNAYNNLGAALMRAGKLDESILAYQQSLELKQRLGDRPGEGSCLNNLGNLWERRGDLRKAFQCYRRGVRIYRRLNRPRELMTLYYNMGEVDLRRGRLLHAERLFGRALEHATGLGSTYIAQMVSLNRGAAELALLDAHACLRTLQAALPEVARSGLANVRAQFHALLAQAYGSLDERAAALQEEELAARALDCPIEEEAKTDALLSLAESALQLGRIADAELRARTARDMAVRGARPYPRARALRILAAVGQQRGDWDVAETQLEEAAQICRDLGFRHELAKCYKGLGSLHWDVGLRARAEEDFTQRLLLLEGLGLRTELGLAYLDLARLMPGETSS